MTFTFPDMLRNNKRLVIVGDMTDDTEGNTLSGMQAIPLPRQHSFNSYFLKESAREAVMIDRESSTDTVQQHSGNHYLMTGGRSSKIVVEKQTELQRVHLSRGNQFMDRKGSFPESYPCHSKEGTLHPPFAAAILTTKLSKGHDQEDIGSVKTRQFLRDVGLDPTGKASVLDISSGTSSLRHPNRICWKDKNDIIRRTVVEKEQTAALNHSMKRPKSLMASVSSFRGGRETFVKSNSDIKGHHQRLDVSDKYPPYEVKNLFKFSQALLTGFQLFDYNNDGFVSSTDFQHVIDEFEVDGNLSQMEPRVSNSITTRVNYQDFVSKFLKRLQYRHGATKDGSASFRKHWQLTPIAVPCGHVSHGLIICEFGKWRETYVTLTSPPPGLINTSHTMVMIQMLGSHRPKMSLQCLLRKIRHQVLQQREYLKTYFQARDRMGLSHIPTADMKAVMRRLYFTLSDGEMECLCRIFDFSHMGRFHYDTFMDCIAALPPQEKSKN